MIMQVITMLIKGLQSMHIPSAEYDYMQALLANWSDRAGAAMCAITGMRTRYMRLYQLEELATRRVEIAAPTFTDIEQSDDIKITKLEWANLNSNILHAKRAALANEDIADTMAQSYAPFVVKLEDEAYESISCERLAMLEEEKLDLDAVLQYKQRLLERLQKYGCITTSDMTGYVVGRCYANYSYPYNIHVPSRLVRMMEDSVNRIIQKINDINARYKKIEKQYKSKAARERANILRSGCRLRVRFV